MAAPYDPLAPARHLMAAAPLILARKHWSKSEHDRVEIVELARGWRIDVIGDEDGKPMRRASAHERNRKYAEMLAASFCVVAGCEVRRVPSEGGSMIALTLPPVTEGDWIGALIDKHEIAGTTMHRVQLRGRDRGAVERNWFASRDEAFAFALDRADRRCFPVLDCTGGEAN